MIEIRLKAVMETYEQRTGHKITYEEIAKRTGLSLATVQSLGSRADYNPRLSTIDLLCDALSCGIADLLAHHTSNNAEDVE